MTFAVGDSPRSIAVGDFNRDGAPDIAVANSGTDDVSVLIGSGTGGFVASTPLAVHDSPQTVVASDVDLDGDLDLVVPNFLSDDVSILLGDGDGAFGAATNLAVGNQPTAVTVGDFNRDGKPDLAFVRLSGTTVAVLTGNGNGTFNAPTTVSLSGAVGIRAIQSADIDRDGDLDLVVATADVNNDGAVTILKGNGAGAFAFGSTTTVSDELSDDLILSDLDRDGVPDVISSHANAGGISVALGDGSGGLSTPVQLLAGERGLGLAAADLNQDGKPDLLVGLGDSSKVTVLLGDGAGGFAAPVDFTIGGALAAGPFGVATGDFDLDGRFDLATSNNTEDKVAVRLSTCGDPPPVPTPTPTPTVHGFVPVDKVALGCSDTVAKAVGKAVSSLVGCRRKAASKAFKAKPFDQGACELAVLASYDKAIAKLFAKKACPGCLGTSVADLRQRAANLDDLRDPPYCAGTVEIP